jgi:hypothetical protein
MNTNVTMMMNININDVFGQVLKVKIGSREEVVVTIYDWDPVVK